MSIHGIFMVVVAVLSAVFTLFPSRHAEAAAAPQITGVWSCQATRPGSTIPRPITFVFHADGTFAYSSQTTVNGGALSLPFTSRGGANGEWQKTGPNGYSYRSRENMYIDGNAGGFFYVDATLSLDPKTGQLCSGSPDCPGTETNIRLTKFAFAANGSITGELDLLPAGSQAVTICERLSVAFPGLP